MSAPPPRKTGAAAAAAASAAPESIEDEFAQLAARFSALAADCRLSFLEVKLYRKYFVETTPKTPEKLSRLATIVATLDQHRRNTIAVLKAIHERESIVAAIHAQVVRVSSSSNRNASVLDFQSDGLHLIYLHQQVTLRVVEAVENWRRPLTRPFPFVHHGENYFAKVLADCADVSASSLGKILPVKLAQYPLCSDLPSLCLFVTANPAAAVSKGGGKQAPSTRMSSEMAAKIASAQAILLEEIETQKRLLRELEGLSAAGYFLPVINLAGLIPSCASGIRMSNHEWESQLRGAIAEARVELTAAEERAHNPQPSPGAHRAHPAGDGGGRAQASASGAAAKRGADAGGGGGDYDDDFNDDASSSSTASSASSRSRASDSPASTPPKQRAAAPGTASGPLAAVVDAPSVAADASAKEPAPPPHGRRVSIEERPRPASASGAGNDSSRQPQPQPQPQQPQPQPPPRPTSAKKRVEVAPASAAAAPPPATVAATGAAATTTPRDAPNYDDEKFESD
jgi:hypothetical protein